ncbi:FHA domain-containing protein [Uniformispora flossi]|uniref:FHA domain-containing protein n=1 Tax=Uniformispora flossi TaxID=3390723 RepID=UPI003C304263
MPPQPPVADALWIVTITADHEYFQRVVAQGGPDASGMRFPPYHEPRPVYLQGSRMRVGRRRTTETASGAPEIDLSGPPSDPGISHLHVVFMHQEGIGWTLVDPGSRNGTTINGGEEAIDANVPIVLRDGFRVHIGAWTTLEIRVVQG